MMTIYQDRQTSLLGTLVVFLVLNNVTVVTRIYTHYQAYYRKGAWIFLEDVFLLLSGVGIQDTYETQLIVFQVLVDVVIGNLFAGASIFSSPSERQC